MQYRFNTHVMLPEGKVDCAAIEDPEAFLALIHDSNFVGYTVRVGVLDGQPCAIVGAEEFYPTEYTYPEWFVYTGKALVEPILRECFFKLEKTNE